ncbi:MAG: hypothetical protein ACE5GA_00100 [Candidatus Zixiibacteriota bacterium]
MTPCHLTNSTSLEKAEKLCRTRHNKQRNIVKHAQLTKNQRRKNRQKRKLADLIDIADKAKPYVPDPQWYLKPILNAHELLTLPFGATEKRLTRILNGTMDFIL